MSIRSGSATGSVAAQPWSAVARAAHRAGIRLQERYSNPALTLLSQTRRIALHVRESISVLVVVAALSAAAARASVVPAWSYVPAAVRGQLAAKGDGTLYLPARTPAFYRYRAGAKGAGGVISVPFTNRVRVHAGLWRWTAQTFLWRVQPATPSIDCQTWRTNERTLQLSGNKVYSGESAIGGSIAWRCVVDRKGRTLILSSSTVRAGQGVAMGVAVASALDVASR
jgi:hypothetical protein